MPTATSLSPTLPVWMASLPGSTATLLATLLGFIGLVVLLWLQRRRVRTARGKPLPTPPNTHWLWGNAAEMGKYVAKGLHMDEYVKEVAPVTGQLFELKLGILNMVIVLDPEAVREVIHGKNYRKSPTYSFLHPFIGDKSILTAEGEVWYRQRRAFNPGFSSTFLKTLVPVFVAKTRVFLSKLDALAQEGAAFKFHHAAQMLMMDIICAVAMNKSYDFMGSSERPPPILAHFMELLEDCTWWGERPHLSWARGWPFLPSTRRIARSQRRLDAIIMDIVDEHAAGVAAGRGQGQEGGSGAGSGANSILALALKTAQAEGGALDKDEIVSQIKTFLFAGHDTTASTISFVVYELSQHPEEEARVVQELRQVLGRAKPGDKGGQPDGRTTPDGSATSQQDDGAAGGRGGAPGGPAFEVEIDADKLSMLRYTTAVIKEVLRMWPPGGTARWGPEGATLQGYDISNKVLYVPHILPHRDKAAWGPDADEFRPSRWLAGGGTGGAAGGGGADGDGVQGGSLPAGVHPFQYMPFSRGPRDCQGQAFAMLELRTVIALMYSRFTFEYAYPEPEGQGYSITSRPMHGTVVKVHRR